MIKKKSKINVKNRITLIILVTILILPFGSAIKGSMKLLAVSEIEDNKLKGSLANLDLEIVPGTGRLFIDTYPLSKVDTQISTRFAKEIACDFLGKYCERYDFFYTIRANTHIIGGPSGSSAITALTIILLDDLEYDQDIALTGTINSGGFIGPVGGVKEKIEAAAEEGIRKALIPTGTSILEEDNETNTTNLIEYGKELNITVVQVKDINEVIYEFTGKKYPEINKIEIKESYSETMKKLAENLCSKSKELQKEIMSESLKDIAKADKNLSRIELASNLTEKGYKALDNKKYYSSASYCFGANVKYKELLLELKNKTDIDSLAEQISSYSEEINNIKYKTITDLQAIMVVKERLAEAKDSIKDAYEKKKNNNTHYADYAYAEERLYSARSWAKFIGQPGKEFEFKKDVLKKSCTKKIAEAEERYQYLNLFMADMKEQKEYLEKAKDEKAKENYELCLFRASKSKAQLNSILNFIGIKKDKYHSFIKNKLNVTRKNIAKNIKNNVFPIVGYSYFEYANELVEDKDYYSSMLYGEYALELSNLNIYFKEPAAKKINMPKIQLKSSSTIYFILGLTIGVFLGLKLSKKRK